MPTITAAERLHVALMLTLTFSTGIIDAAGYIGLDRVFTGNMTGNVVILGMGLLGADGLPVVGPVIALAGFMVGAVVAGRVLRPVKAGWTMRTTTLLGIVGGILAVAALVGIPLEMGHVSQSVQWSVTGILGFAMGMQAGTARHIGVKDVTTVVVTSTITGLAFDSKLGSGLNQPWLRRALAVILIGLGALLGVALVHLRIAAPLGAAAIITIAVAAIGHSRTAVAAPSPSAGSAAPAA